MVDPITGAALSATAGEVAKAGGGVLSRLFGPVADEIGRELLVKYRNRNVQRVVEQADEKADTGSEGAIPPRVAADVFEKAQWAENEFVAEYLSGVLASARTESGDDDGGVTWTALVGRLSSAQLRLHYVLYSTASHFIAGRTIEFIEDLEDLAVYAPLRAITDLLGGADHFNEASMNLSREQLIGTVLVDPEGTQSLASEVLPNEPCIVYTLSVAGVLLYFRGGGSRLTVVSRLPTAVSELSYTKVDGIPVPIPGARLIGSLAEFGS